MSPALTTVRSAARGALLLAVVVALGASASTAGAASVRRGVAPLFVPNTAGKLNTSISAHISFRLPTGSWHASRSETGDVLRNGAYFRTTQVNGKRCVVSVSVGGRGQQHRPPLNTTHKSDHVQRGTTGAVHWLSAWSQLPPTPPLPYAKAYGPAPSWATWHWTSFNLGAQSTEPATAACRRSMLRINLAAVAGSVRVERGSLTAAPHFVG